MRKKMPDAAPVCSIQTEQKNLWFFYAELIFAKGMQLKIDFWAFFSQ